MAEETTARVESETSARAETAEIRAWRVDKVRGWPRRARTLAVRIVALCIFAALALVVLGQAISLTTSATRGVSGASAPHQK